MRRGVADDEVDVVEAQVGGAERPAHAAVDLEVEQRGGDPLLGRLRGSLDGDDPTGGDRDGDRLAGAVVACGEVHRCCPVVPNASGVLTCSGRNPSPITRAGIRLRIGNRRTRRRGQGMREVRSARQDAVEDAVLDEHLQPLRQAGRELAPALHLAQRVGPDAAGPQRGGEEVGRRDRVLDGEVDADAADGRHGVGRVPDAQQAGPIPPPQAIDRRRSAA